MHPLVQSALKSAREGENNNAIGLLKQVLTANPGDIDAWLVLAAVVDHPQRKRQCFNRVLAIDPAHPLAREELDQMDRAEAGEMESYAKEPASDTALLDRDEVPPTGYASTSATFESGSAEPGAPPAPVWTSLDSSPS